MVSWLTTRATAATLITHCGRRRELRVHELSLNKVAVDEVYLANNNFLRGNLSVGLQQRAIHTVWCNSCVAVIFVSELKYCLVHSNITIIITDTKLQITGLHNGFGPHIPPRAAFWPLPCLWTPTAATEGYLLLFQAFRTACKGILCPCE